MKIEDFEFCGTPVVECDVAGTVRNKNPAAKKLLPGVRKGSILRFNDGIASFSCGTCIAVTHEQSRWLLFADFLQFDFESEVFAHAEEYMSLSCEEFLLLESEISSLRSDPKDNLRLSRIRRMMYDRFSFVFGGYTHPERMYQINTFFSSYCDAAAKSYEKIGGRVRFDIQCTDNFRFLNARNAAILLTQLTTFLLFHTKNGCARITARASGDFIRVTFEAHLTGAGAGSVRERDIVGLCAFFPESAIDLLAVDMTVRACGYLIEYTLTEDGAIAVDLYLKAEDHLCDLLDKAVGRGIVKDITAMIMRASAFC